MYGYIVCFCLLFFVALNPLLILWISFFVPFGPPFFDCKDLSIKIGEKLKSASRGSYKR